MPATSVPTVDIQGPNGRRLTVAARSGDDRVGDLADALGLDPRAALHLDGRAVARHETLAGAGIVRGSRLDPAVAGAAGPVTRPDPAAPPGGDGDAVVTVVGEAGPGAGIVVDLPPGRHIVGRSVSATVTVSDDALEPHHALLDVDAAGAVRFVQLAGRVVGRIGGEPVASPAPVPDGGVLVIGPTRLRVGRKVEAAGRPAVLTGTPGDPWRRTLRRTARPLPRWDPPPIPLPAATGAAARPSPLGLLTAGMSLLGSIGIAVVMDAPMFLLFGAAGVLASVGMWLAGRIGAAREGRRGRAGWDRDVAAFTAAVELQRGARWRHHVATASHVAEAITASTTLRADVWARRGGDGAAFRATIGWGAVDWELAIDPSPAGGLPVELARVVAAAERFADAAVPVDLGPGAALAVGGRGADAVVRALIVQLATWVGPADWRLVVVADQPGRWEWCTWLPHAAAGRHVVAADDVERVADALARPDDGDHHHVVVVTDRPDLLAQRTGPMRRFIGGAPSVAVIVVLPVGEAAPAMCRSVLEIGSVGVARWWPSTAAANAAESVHAAGVAPESAAEVARVLARLHDPEDTATAASALASAVGIGALSERHGTGPIDDAIAIAAAWRAGGADPAPAAAIGLTADGVVEIDLARDGPHALIAGTTGAGKSELLRTLVVALAARSSPDHLTFVLVDYKGGATFDACADLPHTVGLVTDLDDRLAERALVSLDAEIRRRERLLREVGATDLTEYRAGPSRSPLPRLVVVVDEFAALAADLPSFVPSLVGVAQRGRSLGIHLVLATQRPAGVVSDDIRANTNLRVALRLQDVADARDVVGDDGPVSFPRSTPGRTMLRLGPGETVVFQAARSTGPMVHGDGDALRVVAAEPAASEPDETELAVLVRSIRNAAALSDIAVPHRPWAPALPAQAAAPADGAVGLVDVPTEQRHDALRWRPRDGNLALLGRRGAGTTTALLSLVTVACRDVPATAVHVYVLDAGGDERLDQLAAWPHCGGVVRLHEAERLGRLLRRLTTELDDRRAGGGRSPHVILAVDAMPAVRAALDTPRTAGTYEALARIVAEGPGAGIVCVMTAERPGAIPAAMLAGCADRWLFHLDDPGEAGAVGLPAVLVPVSIPGRLRVASSRLEAQVAAIAPGRPPLAVERGPLPVAVLPLEPAARDLPPGRVGPDGELELVVGVDHESLAPAVLTVPDGEHVLVAGPARSGRSTALARLATSWRAAHPDGTLRVVAPARRSALASWPEAADLASALAAVERGGAPCLLVVDDAERVDDAGGALAVLAAERRPGLLVVAAGRPDALRAYGHWTAIVRRSRIGLLLAACADVDGDLLGEILPREPPLAARPGLAWVVGGGQRALAQIGRDAGAVSSS